MTKKYTYEYLYAVTKQVNALIAQNDIHRSGGKTITAEYIENDEIGVFARVAIHQIPVLEVQDNHVYLIVDDHNVSKVDHLLTEAQLWDVLDVLGDRMQFDDNHQPQIVDDLDAIHAHFDMTKRQLAIPTKHPLFGEFLYLDVQDLKDLISIMDIQQQVLPNHQPIEAKFNRYDKMTK